MSCRKGAAFEAALRGGERRVADHHIAQVGDAMEGFHAKARQCFGGFLRSLQDAGEWNRLRRTAEERLLAYRTRDAAYSLLSSLRAREREPMSASVCARRRIRFGSSSRPCLLGLSLIHI